MKLTSPTIKDGGVMPKKYAGDGPDVSPPLHLDEIPAQAKSLALLVDDPDAPKGPFNHWVVYNIDPHTHDFREGSVPVIAAQGQNDFGEMRYNGPRPPSGEHHYHFKAFALDCMLNLPAHPRHTDVEKAMEGHVLDQAELTARYAKN
ncbi:MAG TPA: YbhB/YbcL family Raf kinase inhibitor-like protein [Verrucomicrobiae bacterium]|jgi:Raf kinase inhibitor-like YbhB/YbcL family protein